MSDIKKPKWDSCPENKLRGITRSHKGDKSMDWAEIDGPVNVGESVSAYYKGNKVYIKIEDKIKDTPLDPSKTVYSAKITGFNPPAMQYEDLALYDLVQIAREYICWIQRRD